MNSALVDRIAHAVLYEGYILYPYRPALKNRQRWTFGGLYPRAYSEAHSGSDAWAVETECLVVANPQTTLAVKVRFLHLMERTVGEFPNSLSDWPDDLEPEFRPVPMLQVGDEQFQSWQEAVERDVALEPFGLGDLISRPEHREFTFPGRRTCEPLCDPAGKYVGALIREQQPVDGTVDVAAERLTDELAKVTVRIGNGSVADEAASMGRDEALMHSLVSTHALLGVRDGEFVSLIDPPERWREFAAACRNLGMWPVLVGEEGQTDAMLSAPIILYDHPQVAAESPGDLFDCTEIDEILTLRILTLTDEEKREAGGVDERARLLLERTEALAREQLMGLHGTFRDLRPIQGGN